MLSDANYDRVVIPVAAVEYPSAVAQGDGTSIKIMRTGLIPTFWVSSECLRERGGSLR